MTFYHLYSKLLHANSTTICNFIALLLIFTGAKYPDNSIKLWDVKNGKLLKSIDSIAPRAVKLYFVCNDTIILAHFHNKIVGLKESGEILYTIPIPRERTLFCPADKGRVVFLVFQDNTIEWFDAKSGKKTETIICPEGVRFGDTGVAVSKLNYTLQ